MLTVNAYAATSATEPLTPTTVERRDVGPHDILIEIKYAGICHSDISNARSEWGPSTYPVVPRHEIAGVVTEVGSEVTRHAVGDRVGQLPARHPPGRGKPLPAPGLRREQEVRRHRRHPLTRSAG